MFESCGFKHSAFYPCYGMAESTLFISGGYKKTTPVIKYLDKTALEKIKLFLLVQYKKIPKQL